MAKINQSNGGNPFKFWTTKLLKEVIEENYHRGRRGKDYYESIEEIKEEYNKRMQRKAEKDYEKWMKQMEK